MCNRNYNKFVFDKHTQKVKLKDINTNTKHVYQNMSYYTIT
jgi:hypothetical protein